MFHAANLGIIFQICKYLAEKHLRAGECQGAKKNEEKDKKNGSPADFRFPGFIFKTDQSPVIYLILAQKKPPRCISAGGGYVLIAQGVYARVLLISIMNQTDGVPEGLLEVIHGFHTGATDVHIVRQTRTTVRTRPVADVLIDVVNCSAIAAAGSR